MLPAGDRYSDSDFDVTDRCSGPERSARSWALRVITHPHPDPVEATLLEA